MKRFDTYLGRIAAAAILLVTGGLLSSCNKSDDGPKLDKITVTVSEVNATATTAEFIGVVERESKAPADAIVGIEYSTAEDFSGAAEVTGLDKQFSEKVTGLLITTRYYYRTFVEKKGQRTYGDVESFTTNSVSASILTYKASSTKAEIDCEVDPEVAGSSTLAAGIELSADETFADYETIAAETISKEGKYTISLEGLVLNTYYYIRPYIEQAGSRTYGKVQAFATTGVKFNLNVTLVEKALLRVHGNVEVDEADMDVITVGYQVSTDSEFSEDATSTVEIPANQYGDYDSGNQFNLRKPSTTYYYRSYVLIDGEYYYNDYSTHTTDALEVIGYELKNVTATSASCMPMYNSMAWDFTGVDEAGVAYSTDENFLTSGNGITHVAMQDDPFMPGMGFYSISVSGLTPATGYYYTYYIKRGEEYAYGPAESVLSFVTLPDASCISVNEVKPESFTPGKVIFTGSSQVSELAKTTYSIVTSLEYATKEDFSDKTVQEFTGNLSFQKNDLKPATTYYYRVALAYKDSKGDKTLYTAVKSFTTDEIALTCNMSSIKETSMTASMGIGYSGWDISGLEFGVILSTDSDCSLSSSDVINKPSLVDDWGGGMLFITSSFSDLTPGTTYYYRGYIKRNGEYAHWTEIKSATTKIKEPSVTFVKVEPNAPNMDFHIDVANWDNEDHFKVGIQYGYTADLSDGTVLFIDRSKDAQSTGAQWKKQVNTKVPSITLYYCSCYAPVSDPLSVTCGEIKSCKMSDMDPYDLTFQLDEYTSNSASFSGTFFFLSPWEPRDSKIQFGVICSTSENATLDTPGVVNVEMTAAQSGWNLVLEPATATGLAGGTTYYYRSYYKVGETVVYLHSGSFTTLAPLTTVEVKNEDLSGFKGASTGSSKTTTVGDLTLTLNGIGGAKDGVNYAKLGTTSDLAITAPKAIKEINLTVDSFTGTLSVKESPSSDTALASQVLDQGTSAKFTLSSDLKTVYVTSSTNVKITALTVTY